MFTSIRYDSVMIIQRWCLYESERDESGFLRLETYIFRPGYTSLKSAVPSHTPDQSESVQLVSWWWRAAEVCPRPL